MNVRLISGHMVARGAVIFSNKQILLLKCRRQIVPVESEFVPINYNRQIKPDWLLVIRGIRNREARYLSEPCTQSVNRPAPDACCHRKCSQLLESDQSTNFGKLSV